MELQICNTLEVPDVAGHQHQVMVDSRRGNQEVGIRDELAPPPQIAANTGKALHDGPIQGEYIDVAEEVAEARFCSFGISRVVNPLVDLTESDKADGKTLPTQ